MVNALLLLGVALIIGGYCLHTTQLGAQRQPIRIDTTDRKPRR